MAFKVISDENYKIGHAIVTGKNVPAKYRHLRQASEIAITGLLKGYPDLGLVETGHEIETDAYTDGKSDWSKALINSDARQFRPAMN